MNRSGTMLICVVSGLAFGTGARAVTADAQDNPYKAIVDRNLFALKSPPLPPRPEDLRPPPPKITLQGTTSILGTPQVLFKTPPQPKPGQPAKENTYVLSVGQSEDDIEVLEIDEATGTVKFNNNGKIEVLDLNSDKDSAKSPLGAPPSPVAPTIPGLPGLPGVTGTGLLMPGGRQPSLPAPGTAAAAGPNLRTIPPRTLRLPRAGVPTPTGIPTPMGIPSPTTVPAPTAGPVQTPDPAQTEPPAPPSGLAPPQMDEMRNNPDPEGPPMPPGVDY